MLLSAGLNQTLSVTFTPDSPNFESVTTTVMIDVNRADPVISWDNPNDIVVGTVLSEAQLNATATVAGTFDFDPMTGTVLEVGAGQVLSTTFTPEDTALFNVVTATVTIDVIEAQDYGDAPSDYPVLLADDGARHSTTSLTLGSQVDLDVDGAPSDLADGDGSDEDGVSSLADLVAVPSADTVSSFTVTASQAGRLDGWIDFNSDGDWDDGGEQVFTNVELFAGDNTLSYSIPAGATVGGTAARFRLSTAGNLAPTGSAADGEVEDYLVSILNGESAPAVEVDIPGDGGKLSVEAGILFVRSGQTELFRSPIANLGSLSIVGSEPDETVSIDVGNDFSVPANGILLTGGNGGNTLAVTGDQGQLDLTDPLIIATEFRSLDLSGPDANTITIDAAAVNRLSPSLKVVSIDSGEGDQLIVSDASDWRLGDPLIGSGVFVVTANQIAGGGERIEANVPRPWQNFLQASDVNNDGSVTVGDALRIINELDRRRYSDSITQILHAPLSVETWPGAYYDQNGDGQTTALDALRVINELADIESSRASSEGEAAGIHRPQRPQDALTQPSQSTTMPAATPKAGPVFGSEKSESNRNAANDIDDPKAPEPADSQELPIAAWVEASNTIAQDLAIVSQAGPSPDEQETAIDQLLGDESFLDRLSD